MTRLLRYIPWRGHRTGVLLRISRVLLSVSLYAVALACRMVEAPPTVDPDQVFSPARPNFSAAARDFFGMRPEPVQPLEFPHNVHVARKIGCALPCHAGVTRGAVAGLPSVRTCMICHVRVATDRPRIQQLAELRKQGLDLAWQRVYGYPAEAHVRFDHAPHIRAKVECSTCHGPIDQQTVAQRNVNLTMGFCVNCHTERRAPNDCQTCHY